MRIPLSRSSIKKPGVDSKGISDESPRFSFIEKPRCQVDAAAAIRFYADSGIFFLEGVDYFTIDTG